jgi:hypothetical protein
MTRHYVLVCLLFLIPGVLFVAGCLDLDYNPDHDIILIKVTSTGALEWSKIFDSGKDDIPISFFQTSDGGYAMLSDMEDKYHLGWYHRNLVKFSDTGDEQWNRTLYQLNCGSQFLILDPDGLLLTYVPSPELGEICKFNLRGDLVWNGTAVTIGNESKTAAELYNTTNAHSESVRPGEKGNSTKIQPPLPVTGRCIPTFDGGFSCAELQNNDDKKSNNPFEERKTTVIVKKLDADGILMWEQPVTSFCKPKYRDNIGLASLIQTSDGGYFILGNRDNFWKC